MTAVAVKRSASRPDRSAPTCPFIIALGATMSAPAVESGWAFGGGHPRRRVPPRDDESGPPRAESANPGLAHEPAHGLIRAQTSGPLARRRGRHRTGADQLKHASAPRLAPPRRW